MFSTFAVVDPTQPNPWVNPTHGQLCASCIGTLSFPMVQMEQSVRVLCAYADRDF